MAKKITSDEPNQLAFSDFIFDDDAGTVVEKPSKPTWKPAKLRNLTGKSPKARSKPIQSSITDSATSTLPEDKTYKVGEFLDTVNQMFKPLTATVQGEVSSVQERGSAVYFSITDTTEKAVMPCFIWKNKILMTGVTLREGLEVKLVGKPSIYKPFGKFSFETDFISPVGEGALKMAFEQLKRQLEKDGYFDLERKRQLPKYVQTIGLITSEFGDARKDFITHLGNHGLTVLFKDVRVEGVRSIQSVVQAIKQFNEMTTPEVDVLVITRGGGSLESLQAFNSVEVAKAIFSSRIPVISAVGHENDISIADLVSDVRASTPTHAGKILGQAWQDAENLIGSAEQTLITLFRQAAQQTSHKLELYRQQYIRAYERALLAVQNRLDTTEQILTLSDPELKLKQGYSITYNTKGQIIKSKTQIKKGEKLKTQLHKGIISSITE